jgi:Leucine-rich repeat (LRR) protein
MNVSGFCFFLLVLISCESAYSQNNQRSVADIRKEMAEIRRTTDWSDPAKAAVSQKKIEDLSKQLQIAAKTQQQQASGLKVDSAGIEEEADFKMKLWHQMLEGVKNGEKGDVLLATPIREEIVEAYKNDESPKVKNPQYFEEQTFLCIDMSVPTIQRIIDQMENFKSVKALLITCSKEPVNVDLEDILHRARNYPLEQLHIINFKQFVTGLPDNLEQFTHLKELSLFNNRIQFLPESIASLTSLKTLYLDINPVSTVLPTITSLKELEKLGLAKTEIGINEIEIIQESLPGCKILVQ